MPLYHSSIMQHLPAVLAFMAVSLAIILCSFMVFRHMKMRQDRRQALEVLSARLGEALRHNCRLFARRERPGALLPDEVEIRPAHLDGVQLGFSAGPGALAPDLVGKTLALFFYYKANNRYHYYTVQGNLVRLNRTANGLEGSFTLQTTVQEEQRRRFLRVSPPRFMCVINRLHHACGRDAAGAKFTLMSPDVVTLRDVSSGGLRLHVSPAFADYARLAKGDVIVLNITFTNRDATCTTMDIAGRCMNVIPVPGDGPTPPCKALCVMFQRLCIHNAEHEQRGWTPVDPVMGLPDLHSWVVQVQGVQRGSDAMP